MDFNTQAVEGIKRYINGEFKKSIHTGMNLIDSTIRFQTGDFLVINGEPATGKTTLCLEMACNMAERGYKVQFFSLETSFRTFTERMIANRLSKMNDITYEDVQNNQVDESLLYSLAKQMKNTPLYFYSCPGIPLKSFYKEINTGKPDVVFIDAPHMLADGRTKAFEERMRDIAEKLFVIARKEEVLLISTAWLDRDRSGETRYPNVADAIITIQHGFEPLVLTTCDRHKETIPLALNGAEQRFEPLESLFFPCTKEEICSSIGKARESGDTERSSKEKGDEA